MQKRFFAAKKKILRCAQNDKERNARDEKRKMLWMARGKRSEWQEKDAWDEKRKMLRMAKRETLRMTKRKTPRMARERRPG